jgi:hypothetical protein
MDRIIKPTAQMNNALQQPLLQQKVKGLPSLIMLQNFSHI